MPNRKNKLPYKPEPLIYGIRLERTILQEGNSSRGKKAIKERKEMLKRRAAKKNKPNNE